MADHGTTRYEQLADEMAQAMLDGLLRAGDRLPSVRQTCARRGISPSTVFQAYGLLEARGLIDARPRSGYYVSAQKRPARAVPQPAVPAAGATSVAVSALAFDLLESTREAAVVPLGSAFPAPHLFPFEALARSGARAMRRLKPAQITSALTAGDPGLRQALRRRYALQGVPLAEAELVITNGAMEALNLCLQAVTQPGDVVVIESPTFYAALQALERLNLKAVEVATDPGEGVDLQALAELLTQHKVAACWFMPNLQNPLGALMPTPRKQALVA
ncbi:MAG: GntR family transcriptional regulator, partial [Burkholderiales bacterium PBB5]